MARAELNSLLDRAVEAEHEPSNVRDPDEDLYRRFSLDQISDAELEAELDRRHRARQEGARAGARAETTGETTGRSGASGGNTRQAAGGPSTARPRPQPPRPTTAAPVDDELRSAYAALEVPVGADMKTVRSAYRTLMRKYHPDRQQGSPEKLRAATELAQKLTLAYKLIERRSRG